MIKHGDDIFIVITPPWVPGYSNLIPDSGAFATDEEAEIFAKISGPFAAVVKTRLGKLKLKLKKTKTEKEFQPEDNCPNLKCGGKIEYDNIACDQSLICRKCGAVYG